MVFFWGVGSGAMFELKLYESVWHTIPFSLPPALNWDFSESQ